MLQLTQSAPVRGELEKFSVALRFSDPVSGDTLHDIEADLIACVDELQQAVAEGNHENTLALIRKASAVLTERNRLCKLDKCSAQ